MYKKRINSCYKWLGMIAVIFINLFAGSKTNNRPGREIYSLTQEIRRDKGGSYLTLSQGITHYELRGKEGDDVIVLIHGATLAMWVWDRQMEPLVQAGFRVLRYNQYSRGLSDYLPVQYNQEVYQRQLLDLLDSLRIDKPVSLVVHSFGGLIGSLFTAKHPERVDKVVFIAPGVAVSPLIQVLLKSPIAKWYVKSNLKSLSETIDQRLQEMHIPLDPYKALYLEQIQFKGFEKAVISLYRNAVNNHMPFYKEIGKQKRSAMIIVGSDDTTVKRKYIDSARKVIPDVQFHVLEHIGHVPQFEATERVNALLLEFLLK